MSQFTLRNVPAEVERSLRAAARKHGESINATVNRILAEALGVSRGADGRRDLSDLAGSWTPEEAAEFQRAVQEFERIDPEIWQQR